MWIGKGGVLANDTNGAMGVSGAAGAETTPLIELRDVVFSYTGHTVVDGVSLQVDRGELVAPARSQRLRQDHDHAAHQWP